jgi:hypothetical protein
MIRSRYDCREWSMTRRAMRKEAMHLCRSYNDNHFYWNIPASQPQRQELFTKTHAKHQTSSARPHIYQVDSHTTSSPHTKDSTIITNNLATTRPSTTNQIGKQHTTITNNYYTGKGRIRQGIIRNYNGRLEAKAKDRIIERGYTQYFIFFCFISMSTVG